MARKVGIVKRATKWVKKHPVLTIAIVAGAYLIWKRYKTSRAMLDALSSRPDLLSASYASGALPQNVAQAYSLVGTPTEKQNRVQAFADFLKSGTGQQYLHALFSGKSPITQGIGGSAGNGEFSYGEENLPLTPGMGWTGPPAPGSTGWHF